VIIKKARYISFGNAESPPHRHRHGREEGGGGEGRGTSSGVGGATSIK
jgi:hypothetical protein